MDSAVHIRTATPADLDPISDLMSLVFHERPSAAQRAAEQAMTEPERSVVAEDDGEIVGHTTAQTRDLTIPGSIIPAALVTGVGVAPTHRRRGILTRLMRQQLTDIATAGREPLAVLWASESAIYPHFGYGPASARLALEIANAEVGLVPPPAEPAGRLQLVDPKAAADRLTPIYERARQRQVGLYSRGPKWWDHLLTDHAEPNSEKTGPHGVIFADRNGPAGYAIWSVEAKWATWGPACVATVREVVADHPAAYDALWRFLLGLDLVRTVKIWSAAVDEPLQYLVGESRKLGRRTLDGLWVRLTDLPAALEARQYTTALDVVFEVSDPILTANAGRWRLAGGPDKVTCTRTEDAPDFTCTITDLGAAYLGGTTLASLAAAGRIRQLSGNLPSIAFGWHRAPHPIEMF